MKPRQFLDWTPQLQSDMSRHFDYPTDNTLAIVIPVWQAEAHVSAAPAECYLRQAFWMTKFILEATDAADERVPIYIAVSDTIAELAEQYCDACNFSPSNLLVFEYNSSASHFSNKFSALFHAGLDRYGRLLHMDTCFQFGTHPTQRKQPCFSELKQLWRNGCIAVVGDYKQPRPWQHSMLSSLGGFDGTETAFWDALAMATGKKNAEWQRLYWTQHSGQYWVTGAMFGLPHKFLNSPDFRSLVCKLSQLKGMWDESILLAYMLKHNMNGANIVNVESAFWWANFDDPDVKPYDMRPVMYVPWDSSVPKSEWEERHRNPYGIRPETSHLRFSGVEE